MTTRNAYRILCERQTPQREKVAFDVTVSVNRDGKTRYVTGAGLGCSRDYATPSDAVAVSNLLLENGMRVLKMNPAAK